MKDILPGMTVKSVLEIGLGDTVCMFGAADTENEMVRLLNVPVHQY